MLWTLAILILVLWVIGLIFKIAGGLIHILLIVGLVILAYKALRSKSNL